MLAKGIANSLMTGNSETLLHETLGEGRDVVLMPGGLTGWDSWIPHARSLSKRYRTTRLQLVAVRNGTEDRPLPHDYSLAYERDSLARTVDELGFEEFDLAAWSYGAATSLSYAIHHPNRIRTLTLIEPPAMWVLRSRGPWSSEVEANRTAIAKLGPGPISEEQLIWFCHFAGFVPRDVDPRTLPPWPSWYEHRESLRTQDVVYRHEDNIELVREFAKPVLLVKGRGSSQWLHDIIHILHDEFPMNEIVEYNGGHAPHIIERQPFLERFTSFLESHPV